MSSDRATSAMGRPDDRTSSTSARRNSAGYVDRRPTWTSFLSEHPRTRCPSRRGSSSGSILYVRRFPASQIDSRPICVRFSRSGCSQRSSTESHDLMSDLAVKRWWRPRPRIETGSIDAASGPSFKELLGMNIEDAEKPPACPSRSNVAPQSDRPKFGGISRQRTALAACGLRCRLAPNMLTIGVSIG